MRAVAHRKQQVGSAASQLSPVHLRNLHHQLPRLPPSRGAQQLLLGFWLHLPAGRAARQHEVAVASETRCHPLTGQRQLPARPVQARHLRVTRPLSCGRQPPEGGRGGAHRQQLPQAHHLRRLPQAHSNRPLDGRSVHIVGLDTGTYSSLSRTLKALIRTRATLLHQQQADKRTMSSLSSAHSAQLAFLMWRSLSVMSNCLTAAHQVQGQLPLSRRANVVCNK